MVTDMWEDSEDVRPEGREADVVRRKRSQVGVVSWDLCWVVGVWIQP